MPGSKPAKGADTGPTTKQYALLGVCVAVLGIVLFRQFAGRAAGPASALATDASGEQIAVVNGSRVRVPPIAQAAALVAHWRANPVQAPTRNLFQAQVAAPVTPEPAEVVPDRTGEFWRGLDAAMNAAIDARADQATRRARLRTQLLEDAAKFRVGSVMVGANARATIDGALLKVGDAFGPGRAFELVAIDASGVVAVRAGVQVRLWLGGSRPPQLVRPSAGSVNG